MNEDHDFAFAYMPYGFFVRHLLLSPQARPRREEKEEGVYAGAPARHFSGPARRKGQSAGMHTDFKCVTLHLNERSLPVEPALFFKLHIFCITMSKKDFLSLLFFGSIGLGHLGNVIRIQYFLV